MKLDKWQQEIISTEGNMVINCGRQVGKTTVVSIKAVEEAAKKKQHIVVVSVTEEQAIRIIALATAYAQQKHPKKIWKSGRHKPLKHKIQFKNGSVIKSKAIGQTGFSVLGETVNLLIADEAAFMPENVWNVLTPMLLTTGGSMILISTPHISEGFFYEAFHNPDRGFKRFYISSEEVAENRPEPMRSYMLKHLEAEKESMTELEYKRWYLAEWTTDVRRLFNDELINEICTEKRTNAKEHTRYMGIDVGYAESESTFEIVRIEPKRIVQEENVAISRIKLNETYFTAKGLAESHNVKKIYFDSGGLLGVQLQEYFDEDVELKKKAIPINNASRSIKSISDSKTRAILKEDLYMNLLRLMQQKKIKLLDDDNIKLSLSSVLYEENRKSRNVKIYGRYTHIAEGLVRACWALKEKSLNLWITWS